MASAARVNDPVTPQFSIKGEETFRLWRQLDPLFRWARRAFIITTVLVIGFILLEAVRLYQTLAGIHPWVGIAALVALGIAIAMVVGPAWRFLRMPRVVEPRLSRRMEHSINPSFSRRFVISTATWPTVKRTTRSPVSSSRWLPLGKNFTRWPPTPATHRLNASSRSSLDCAIGLIDR